MAQWLRMSPDCCASSADSGTWAADEARVRNNLAGTNETVPWPEGMPHPRQRFSRASGTRHKVSVFKVRERREPFGLSLRPSRWLWRSGLAFSRFGRGTLENKPVVWFPQLTGRRTVMLLYEMFAIGVAVVLVVAAIGGLAERGMMGPEESALLGLARAAPAQRRLVASAAPQGRSAGAAAAAQRRLVAAAAQQDDWIRRWLKRQYEDALAAPLSPRLATLIAQLETQGVSA